MLIRGSCFLVLALVSLAGFPPALAAPIADPAAKAETLYLEGAALYRARHYQQAVRVFEGAYRVYPEPNLLYNMGRCYEALGRLKDAIERYERFLADNRSAPEGKKKARAKIAMLSQILTKTSTHGGGSGGPVASKSKGKGDPTKVSPVDPTPAPHRSPAQSPSRFGVSKWLVGISALALTGAGAVVFWLGHNDHQEVQDAIDAAGGGIVAMPQAEAVALVDDGDTKKLIGYALMGAGGAALITSVVLFALGGADEAPAATSSSVQVSWMPGGVVLGFGGRF
ncbi:MAG: tetratricopeptide repeat protein [Deltaproteobacteria bacterium]|nr:tetratricopeptide repeat protein [Deltaproteobacteria bacterium]